MFLRRAASFIRRFRFPSPRLTAFRNSTLSSSTIPTCKTQFFPKNSVDSSWKNYHGNLALWITLSGQAAIVLGLCKHPVLAEDVNAADLRTGYDSGETVVTDLRRIEDGSVISNSHTVKWRIYTDNGRDLFLKGIFDEAENYFQSALQEAKEGFGVRDSHVAASCNNLAELYRVKKEFKKAEPLYLEAINILEESFGPVDIRVGAALHNLGQFYLVQQKLEEARQCYEVC
ncbi:kinesin light chain 3 isoform X4 [Cinnamomum micranthum f. kanehirae]|uniref:Kinesin light chain 3 isoform X4 n=1 Tax=Cinnamomum micranthum f. kanehirae TaxID=337451 RepID=A0A443PW09_9MAGN|nr:kinesin light chain 3 isoform X4 [Cinnamomum micranthum f. kanehirae]